MKKLRTSIAALLVMVLVTPVTANANVEVDWSVIGGSPFENPPLIAPPATIQHDYTFNSAPLSETTRRLAGMDVPERNIEISPVTGSDSATVSADSQKQFLGAKWSGRADLGASMQRGNSDTKSIDFDAQTTARWDEIYRAKLIGKYAYEEESDNTTKDKKSLEAQFDYFFRPQWFLNTSAKYERDDIAGLDLRSTYGVGLGHQPFDRDDLKLQYVLGPSYLREERENGDKDDSLAYRWNLDYEQAFWQDKLRLFHNHQLLVPSEDTSRYVLQTESGVRVPIHKGLIASLQIDHDIDKGAPAGSDDEDTKYGLKLGYEW